MHVQGTTTMGDPLSVCVTAELADNLPLRPRAASLEGSTYSFMREISARLSSLTHVSAELDAAQAQIATMHLTIGQLRMVSNCSGTCASFGRPLH